MIFLYIGRGAAWRRSNMEKSIKQRGCAARIGNQKVLNYKNAIMMVHTNSLAQSIKYSRASAAAIYVMKNVGAATAHMRATIMAIKRN